MRCLKVCISFEWTRSPKHSLKDSSRFLKLTRWATCSYIAQLFSGWECLSTLKKSGGAKVLRHSMQRYRGLATLTNRRLIPVAVIPKSRTILESRPSCHSDKRLLLQEGHSAHRISNRSLSLTFFRPLRFLACN